MTLPMPQKSTASHFYKYSSPTNLGWLKDILHQHEIYLPNLTELNDDNGARETQKQGNNFLVEI
jgi:hypothetical protein